MARTRVDPVLTAIVEAATRGTGASHGLLLAIEGRVMRVAASAGALGWDVVGEPISAGEGVAGYVAASGQPLALSADSADPRLGEGTASLLGHNPSAVLAVPVDGGSRIVGVLELIDPHDGLFDVTDTEQAMLHAAVASAALTDARLGALADVPEPAEIAAELRRLAEADPGRYATVATIIEALVR
ncbi:MAG: GAF domain-containing protein [Actinomycetota bacterium]